MRSQFEINRTLNILNAQAQVSPTAKVQAEVISKRMDERAVFEKYVMGVSENQRDEALFFAARDAARYLKGDIDLDLLIPGVPLGNAEDLAFSEEEAGTVTLSRKDFNLLLKRLDRLEQWIGLSRKEATLKPVDMPEGIDMTDMMKQNEACKYLCCGKNTIKKWVAKGFVKAYQQGKYVYYSKKELNKKIRKTRMEE